MCDIISEVENVRGEISQVVAEVLNGAGREDERVVEGGVGETLWSS